MAQFSANETRQAQESRRLSKPLARWAFSPTIRTRVTFMNFSVSPSRAALGSRTPRRAEICASLRLFENNGGSALCNKQKR